VEGLVAESGKLPARVWRDAADGLAAAIPGARSQLYPETGHRPHWERPERFTADLDAF
jgi:pimeloyl-ACP methyl ester carboxylesterase